MSKQNRVTENDTDKKPRKKHWPEIVPRPRLESETGIEFSSDLSAASDQRSVQAQAAHLSDPRISLLHRQMMAGEIDQVYGNMHMQRVIYATNQGQNQNVLQRDRSDETPSATGYVGLNPEARREAEVLERYVRGEVVESLDDPEVAKRLELDTQLGRARFIYVTLSTPALDVAQFGLALHCLESCGSDFREQMAKMIEMFHDAEIGRYRLERLVLSGHHGGGVMWGDATMEHSPGELMPERDLRNLATAFPRAAAQVEDIMFSACNTTQYVKLCQTLFPNLQSIWVYEGYSPSIEQGSPQHVRQWERQTRGRHTPSRRDRMGNAVIWTRERGLIG